MNKDKEISKVGQGFNDSRGEIPDKKNIPKNNGQNLNNDPAHQRANEEKSIEKKPVYREVNV